MSDTFPTFFKPNRISPAVRQLVCSSRDLDELRAEEDAARARCDAAEAAMLAADAVGDMVEYDRASTLFDQADDELCIIGRRADEIEEEAAEDELREQRRDFWSAVL